MGHSRYLPVNRVCTKCGRPGLYPNQIGNLIKGYRCIYCDKVSYPVKERLRIKEPVFRPSPAADDPVFRPQPSRVILV